MDDDPTLLAVKKPKIVPDGKNNDSEDRISDLADSILHHILSLLPTPYAVRTCILSTRWQHHWRSITNLNFECSAYYKKKQECNNSFVHFLEKVLLLHSSNVKVFRISSHDYLDSSRVNSWIYSALTRHVQVLDIDSPFESELVLPRSLCTCDTLTRMRIHSYCDLGLPAVIFFSSLKTLHFVGVRFSNESSIQKLFMSLPVLEDLELSQCGWKAIQKATISIPTLTSLTLDLSLNESYYEFEDYVECHLKIYAENIVHLSCTTDMTIDLVLVNLPLLVHAIVGVGHIAHHPENKKYGSNLFNAIRFAKFLTLNEGLFSFLYYAMRWNPDFLPTFTNLTSVEVHPWVMCRSSDGLMELFRKSPLLESVFIKQIHQGYLNEEPFPSCFKSSLKTCTLSKFRGRKSEVNLLKLLLKISTVLEKIKIYCHRRACPVKLKNVHKMLESEPRVSKHCVIEFVEPCKSVSLGLCKLCLVSA